MLFEQIGKPNWISGTGHGQWLLEAEGRTVAQLWRHLTGNASASITDGEITGVDLTRALEQKTLVPGQDQNGGKTPFSNLQSTLTANGDTITLSDGIMTTEAAKAGFSGTLSLFRQALMLRGSIVTGKDPVRVLTFAIDGPWRKPLFSFENLASSPPATVETPPAVP